MNVPVVLPVVRAFISGDGTVSVTVDGDPYVDVRTVTRGGLRELIAEITAEYQCAVRVEVTESDGTTYADIATPSQCIDQPDAEATPSQPPGLPGLTGTGFRPGEQVAVAYVLMEETADDSGTASVHLPAAALSNRQSSLLLLGLDSNIVTTIAAGTASA